MRAAGGALVNIGSIASDMGTPLIRAYAASKHVVKGFTDSLRMELQHEKAPISVTLIKPASIDTPFPEHARNYLREGVRVPPPAYHPRAVAKALRHEAERQTRSLNVGAGGVLMSILAAALQAVGVRMIASMFSTRASVRISLVMIRMAFTVRPSPSLERSVPSASIVRSVCGQRRRHIPAQRRRFLGLGSRRRFYGVGEMNSLTTRRALLVAFR